MSFRQLLSSIKNGDGGKAQFVRFVINGCISAAIHYAVYYLLLLVADRYAASPYGIIDHATATSAAYVAGYIVSFAYNFYFTCIFTFRARPSLKLFLGFSGSHGVNFLLHLVLFPTCLYVGIHRLIAPFVVMGLAMLVQFAILHFVFKKR